MFSVAKGDKIVEDESYTKKTVIAIICFGVTAICLYMGNEYRKRLDSVIDM